jgi:hypothetical protein
MVKQRSSIDGPPHMLLILQAKKATGPGGAYRWEFVG